MGFSPLLLNHMVITIHGKLIFTNMNVNNDIAANNLKLFKMFSPVA